MSDDDEDATLDAVKSLTWKLKVFFRCTSAHKIKASAVWFCTNCCDSLVQT